MYIFKPIETVSSKIDTISIVPGQYIFCSDTNEVFIDSASGERTPVNKPLSVKKSSTVINSNANSVEINIDGFDSKNDSLLVYLNSVYLTEDMDYVIDSENNTISPIEGSWIAREDSPSVFNFVAFCNMQPTITSKTRISNTLSSYDGKDINTELLMLKHENALLFYTMMINNLNVSNVLTDNKILYFYINRLWTKQMVNEAIEYGLITKEQFESIM